MSERPLKRQRDRKLHDTITYCLHCNFSAHRAISELLWEVRIRDVHFINVTSVVESLRSVVSVSNPSLTSTYKSNLFRLTIKVLSNDFSCRWYREKSTFCVIVRFWVLKVVLTQEYPVVHCSASYGDISGHNIFETYLLKITNHYFLTPEKHRSSHDVLHRL